MLACTWILQGALSLATRYSSAFQGRTSIGFWMYVGTAGDNGELARVADITVSVSGTQVGKCCMRMPAAFGAVHCGECYMHLGRQLLMPQLLLHPTCRAHACGHASGLCTLHSTCHHAPTALTTGGGCSNSICSDHHATAWKWQIWR